MATQKAYKSGSEFPPLAPGKFRLYSMRWCPYAHRAMLVLAHKNIEHEVVNIHLQKKPDWYLKINPLGKVPTIQQDDRVVYESVVVCNYLDETFPGPTLTPADPYTRARDSMLLERFSKVVSAFYKVFFSNGVTDEIREDLHSSLDILEQELQDRGTDFFGGEKPMMIDFMMWPHTERVDCLNDTFPDLNLSSERFRRVQGWIARMKQVPAVQKTLFPLKKYLAEIIKAFKEKSPALDDIYDIGLEE